MVELSQKEVIVAAKSNRRAKFLVLMRVIAALLIPCFSSSQERNGAAESLDRDFANIAKANNSETAKKMCIDHWSKPERLDALSKFATLAEQCSCVQEEMKFLVSEELADRLIKYQIQNTKDLPTRYLTQEEEQGTVKDWSGLFYASFRTCSDKFLRRSRNSR